MLLSRYFFTTYRKSPAPAEVASHGLMLRSGLIRQLGAGIYTWLPMGMRVLHKMVDIVRSEMNLAGAMELSMPTLQPAELWEESGRWNDYGPELMRLHDRNKRAFCLGPTFEEVITDLVRGTLQSYKQLPINLYQIQSKYRDELRPRFGVMRGREFVMKDAYSFHQTPQSLEETYEVMRQSYERIFNRVGLDFRCVGADSGNIGGSVSHEFHVLADSGEDQIAVNEDGSYAANLELAPAPKAGKAPKPSEEMRKVNTAGKHTIDEVTQLLKVSPAQSVKTLVVRGVDTPAIALLIRGDHQLNAVKAAGLKGVESPLKFASDKVLKSLDLVAGTIGPIGLKIPMIADHAVAGTADFCCGAGEADHHYVGVNWGRDCPLPEVADLRNVVAGDPSPDGKGKLHIKRGIEVGHVFQLGQKYSTAMDLSLQDQNAEQQHLWMGCYGIGIDRTIAAVIEQNHDERGILFPPALAPFQLAIVAANMEQSGPVRKAAEKLYQQCLDAGIEVALDDREQRLGVKLSDIELLGIPHRVVISERNLEKKQVEYQARNAEEPSFLAADKAHSILVEKCRIP